MQTAIMQISLFENQRTMNIKRLTDIAHLHK